MSGGTKKALRHRLRARSPSEHSRASLSTKVMLAGLAAVPLALVALLILRPPRHTDGADEPFGLASHGGTAAGPPSAVSAAGHGPPATSDIPPLPDVPHRAARPPEAIGAAYDFAARHPEVLSYIPCFCGCERKGHRSNEDCFVASRAAEGRVVWSPHGMT